MVNQNINDLYQTNARGTEEGGISAGKKRQKMIKRLKMKAHKRGRLK